MSCGLTEEEIAALEKESCERPQRIVAEKSCEQPECGSSLLTCASSGHKSCQKEEEASSSAAQEAACPGGPVACYKCKTARAIVSKCKRSLRLCRASVQLAGQDAPCLTNPNRRVCTQVLGRQREAMCHACLELSVRGKVSYLRSSGIAAGLSAYTH